MNSQVKKKELSFALLLTIHASFWELHMWTTFPMYTWFMKHRWTLLKTLCQHLAEVLGRHFALITCIRPSFTFQFFIFSGECDGLFFKDFTEWKHKVENTTFLWAESSSSHLKSIISSTNIFSDKCFQETSVSLRLCANSSGLHCKRNE